MKIAFFIESLDPRRGGRETSTIQVAAELARRGHEVSIFCQSAALASAGEAAAPYHVVCLPSKAKGKLARLKDFIRQSQEIIRAGDFDITQSVLPIPACTGGTPVRRMGETGTPNPKDRVWGPLPMPRHIYQPRGGIVPAQLEGSLRRRHSLLPVWLRFRLLQLFRRRQAHLWRLELQVMSDEDTYIISVSRLVADDVSRYYARTNSVREVFNAVDIPDADRGRRQRWRQEIREKLQLPDDGLLILTIANNPGLKGIKEARAAFTRFLRQSVRPAALIVLGVKGHSTELVSGQSVQILGHVSDVFRYYSAADAVMLLSWQDACSRVVLEAVRWGVPCITTRYNGAAEVLADGAGIVIDSPRDTAAVVSALTQMADPARREEMSKACLAKASYLSIGRHVDELERLYRELM